MLLQLAATAVEMEPRVPLLLFLVGDLWLVSLSVWLVVDCNLGAFLPKDLLSQFSYIFLKQFFVIPYFHIFQYIVMRLYM